MLPVESPEPAEQHGPGEDAAQTADTPPSAEGATQRKPLSPAARAAIARYRRLMGNVAGPEVEDARPDSSRSDLDRHLAERPPHWAPPHRERPPRS